MVTATIETVNIPLTVDRFTQVMVSFDKTSGVPGDDVTMMLSASSDSLCGYGAVDKSVFLKGGNNQLTIDSVMPTMHTLDRWSG